MTYYEIKYENRKTGERFLMEAKSWEEAEDIAWELFDDGWAVYPKIEEVYA